MRYFNLKKKNRSTQGYFYIIVKNQFKKWFLIIMCIQKFQKREFQ